MVGAPVVTLPQETIDADALRGRIERAQNGESSAVEALLQQFRPLLRARMQQLWATLQEQMASVEWADVEAQVQFMFLTRLHSFRADEGVYFPHYIAQMLELDCRAWLRQQQRGAAVPFSQLGSEPLGNSELEYWLEALRLNTEEDSGSATADIERVMSLRDALHTLTEPQRQVIWECCVLGRTENEVAAQLGLSRSAVRNRLNGAVTRLRSFFKEEDEAAPCGGLGPELAQFATRTGRNTAPPLALQHDLWLRRMSMAKDEKRPDLVGIGAGRPVLLQGIYDFEATGLQSPKILSPKLTYTVPPGYVVGILYFRAGVLCDGMVCLSSVVNGLPHRLVPVAANSTIHIPLAIVAPIIAGSQIEIHVASSAPGIAIVDIGCLQMPA
ncbi:MAG: sigma-70 family RNA polymerase sigma factor [Armatimonadota bacterium]|nr:sigma-70 family RNA polymerase sigma factor [Armatimonadota bacterium]